MSGEIRVYVDGRGVVVGRDASALDSVRAFEPGVAEEIAAGEKVITDSRGLPVSPDTAAYAGAIYRVIRLRLDSGTGLENDPGV